MQGGQISTSFVTVGSNHPAYFSKNISGHNVFTAQTADGSQSAEAGNHTMSLESSINDVFSVSQMENTPFYDPDDKISFANHWLQENYVSFEGISVARCALYSHYIQSCNILSIECVNPASFGKIIRSNFPALKTRRLGTRGNSKYHYYGIKPRNIDDPSIKNQITFPERSEKGRRSAPHGKHAAKGDRGGVSTENFAIFQSDLSDFNASCAQASAMLQTSADNSQLQIASGTAGGTNNFFYTNTNMFSLDAYLQVLHESTQPIPGNLPESMDLEGFYMFIECFRLFCYNSLRFVVIRDFNSLENSTKDYWSRVTHECQSFLELPETLRIISGAEEYVSFVVMEHLGAEVFSDAFSPPVAKFLIKYYETYFTNSQYLGSFPHSLQVSRLQLGAKFISAMKRRLVLNQLYLTTKSILVNDEQNMMLLKEWDLVDFGLISESASAILGISDGIVSYIQRSIRYLLENKQPLDKWLEWIGSLCENCLSSTAMGFPTKTPRPKEIMIKGFLQRWSFFITQILRDFTIRNSPSFGSCHLIRSFLDEYILYFADRQMEEIKRQPLMGMQSLGAAACNTQMFHAATYGVKGDGPGAFYDSRGMGLSNTLLIGANSIVDFTSISSALNSGPNGEMLKEDSESVDTVDERYHINNYFEGCDENDSQTHNAYNSRPTDNHAAIKTSQSGDAGSYSAHSMHNSSSAQSQPSASPSLQYANPNASASAPDDIRHKIRQDSSLSAILGSI